MAGSESPARVGQPYWNKLSEPQAPTRIYAEKKREAADQKQIAEWIKERRAMILLARSLTVDDMTAIGRVRENYDQKARELSK